MTNSSKETDIRQNLEKQFPGILSNFQIPRERRMAADIDGAKAKDVIIYMQKNLGFDHLPTITGLDSGANFEAVYHLASGGIVFSLHAKVPSSDITLPTVTDIFPGAEDYERELEDMFGFKIEGLRPGNRYPLPDNWPAGQYPLRKSWNISKLYPKEENKCQK